jgi:hypothetical protein
MSSRTAVITAQALRRQWLSKARGFAAVSTGSTTTSDSSQPVIAVESVDGAEHHLLSYLALANPLYDLRLRIPEAVLSSKPVDDILRSILRQKRRFAYDRETSVLRVYAISRPIHDVVSFLVLKFLVEAIRTGFITPKEEKYINCGNTNVRLAQSRFYTNQNTKKLQAWTKFPDATILFGGPKSKPSPSVVFEVGFTESYDDLVSDAAQWLQKSGGKVRLVILVNIKEDIQSQRVRQRFSEARKRIRELIIRFGNAKAKDREEIDHEDSDVESNAKLYDDIESTIMAEDWVGPISAKLEVWHLVDGIAKLRQPPIVSPLLLFLDIFLLTFIDCFARATSSTAPNNPHHGHRTRREESHFRRLRRIQNGRTRYGSVQGITQRWNP